MTPDEAVEALRADPAQAEFLRDVYWDADPAVAAARFAASAEFAAVLQLVGERLPNGVALDVGAGTGIASYALAKHGARRVHALEPDPSAILGRGAIQRLRDGLPIEIHDAAAEAIPLPDSVCDLVYTRQTLHHTRDLSGALRECSRVLKPGGLFIACREHVVNSDRQLRQFLRRHPLHQLVGGEHAFRLEEYQRAIRDAGLVLRQSWGPWESVINAFPIVRDMGELADLPRVLLRRRLGGAGEFLSRLPGAQSLVRAALRYPRPGRLYTFFAHKP